MSVTSKSPLDVLVMAWAVADRSDRTRLHPPLHDASESSPAIARVRGGAVFVGRDGGDADGASQAGAGCGD